MRNFAKPCLIVFVLTTGDIAGLTLVHVGWVNAQGNGCTVFLGIFGEGVPPSSPNPGPISDLNMKFSNINDTQTLHLKIHTHFQRVCEITPISDFQTKTVQIHSHFQTKMAQNPYPLG